MLTFDEVAYCHYIDCVMPSITIRGVDEQVLERIRSLARAERRSMNGELLVLIDRALHAEDRARSQRPAVPKEAQLRIWRSIAGWWEDDRSTERIIADIHEHRTLGRDVDL